MNKLILMMGMAGSGKSTYAKSILKEDEKYVSRDEIRFALVPENEDYFSKEGMVFNLFINTISNYLRQGFTVYADAIHLNKKSRNKIIHALSIEPDEIEVIYMNTPLDLTLERNSFREGRARVPNTVIKAMYNSIELPTKDEGISKLTIVKENDVQEVIL